MKGGKMKNLKSSLKEKLKTSRRFRHLLMIVLLGLVLIIGFAVGRYGS